MGHDDGGIGEHRCQGPELPEVLRRLQHPAVAAAEELQHLQHRLQVLVVRRLVVRRVPVAV